MNAPAKTPPIPAAMRMPRNRQVDSRELFRGGNEVVIAHKGEEYRLRITRQNKLILTK
ncbi:MAG: hemin uptake protein HemP [Gallionella sp.]|nr:MAG: hemin uptake protein HemP [Gallionella sp.]